MGVRAVPSSIVVRIKWVNIREALRAAPACGERSVSVSPQWSWLYIWLTVDLQQATFPLGLSFPI